MLEAKKNIALTSARGVPWIITEYDSVVMGTDKQVVLPGILIVFCST